MKKLAAIMAILCLTVFTFGGVAQALELGSNITIFDGMSSSNGSGTDSEDNECETGMVQSQAWDLEGFFLNDNTLAMVGGYNFVSGHSDNNSPTFDSGDINFRKKTSSK